MWAAATVMVVTRECYRSLSELLLNQQFSFDPPEDK